MLLFCILSLVNVILQTMKTVFTVKSTRNTAAMINAVTFAFYNIVIKQLSDFDVTTTVIVTAAANYIGVHISFMLIEHFRKDNIWNVKAVACREDAPAIEAAFITNDINYIMVPAGDKYLFELYSRTQQDSAMIKGILKPYPVEYHVQEILKHL